MNILTIITSQSYTGWRRNISLRLNALIYKTRQPICTFDRRLLSSVINVFVKMYFHQLYDK